MQRRDFLKTTGLTTSALALAACAPRAHAMPSGRLAPAVRAHADSDGRWAAAVDYARWTPSPHNMQPWRLRVCDLNTAELYCDADRRLPNTDPQSAFTMLTLAMFTEYLGIAFAAQGHLLHAEFEPVPIDYAATAPWRVATLTLEPLLKRLDTTERREALCRRHTSRLPYDGQCVRDSVLERIRTLSASEGHTFGWTHDRTLVRETIAINRDAVYADMNDEIARAELRRWIRPSDREAYATNDGLWSRCMHYPGWLLRDFFDNHEAWTHGARAALGKRLLTHGMRGTRTVAWWSGPFASPADWIRAGRVFAHAWLMLAEADVQLHPFGSVVTNPTAHQQFVERVGGAISLPRTPGRMWLLARMGYSAPAPRSLRVPTSAIFLDESESLT